MPRLTPLHDLLAVAVLAALARVIYGPGAIGYDAAYALVWGEDLAGGQIPDFDTPFAPTPHPLWILMAAPLSLLGDSAMGAMTTLSLVCFGGLAWAGFRAGTALFAPAVGAAVAVLLFTRTGLVNETLQAIVDIPFLAVVLAAIAVEATTPCRWRVVLPLLLTAGLLRPEGWLFAGAYGLYLWRGLDARERLPVAGLVVAAPLLWVLFDLVSTGDPLHSVNGTRDLAAALGRPRDLGTALEAAPHYLANSVGTLIAVAGLLGALATLVYVYERALLPAAVAAIGLGSFLAIGVLGLPVLTRYLLVPAAMLMIFAAALALGWTGLERDDALRRLWSRTVGPLACLALVAALVTSLDGLALTRDRLGERRDVQRDLKTIVDDKALVACGRVAVPEYQAVPLVAFWRDIRPQDIAIEGPSDTADIAFIVYTSIEVGRMLSLVPRDVEPPAPVPPTLRTASRTRNWILAERC